MSLTDPLTAVYLLSGTGAAAFFAAGVAAGRMTRRRDATKPVNTGAASEAVLTELSALRFQLETAHAELEATQQREQALERELGVARATLVMVDELKLAIETKRRALEAAEARTAQLERDLSRARQAAENQRSLSEPPADARWQQLERERDALRAELTQAEAAREAATLELQRREARTTDLQRERDTALAAQRRAEARALEIERERGAVERGRRELEARAAELVRERDAALATAARADAELAERTTERDEASVRLEASQAYVRRAQESTAKLTVELESASREIRELRERVARVQATDERLAQLERENQDLRERIVAGSGDLPAEPLTDPERDQRKLRLENELYAERVRQLEAQREELLELRARCGELEAEATRSRELRRQVEGLEARLFALGGEPPSEGPASSVIHQGTVASQLLALVDGQRVRTVVVADRHGLLVDAAGERATEEGLAAVTGLAGQLAFQAGQLLPLAEIRTVHLTDANSVELVCRLFWCGEDAMALATIGRGAPPEARVDAAVAGVQASMEPAPLDRPVWGR